MSESTGEPTAIFTMPLLSFEPVKFVKSSDKHKTNENQNKHYTVKPTEILDGKAASDFYKEVISQEPSPSTTTTINKIQDQPQNTRKRVKIKQLPKSLPSTQTAKLCSVSEFLKYCEENNVPKVQRELENGFPINSTDNYGWTGLMCAACTGAKNVTQLLLEYGANPNFKDAKGRTAMDLATLKNLTNIIQLLNNYETLRQRYEKEQSKYNKTATVRTNSEFDCAECKETFKDPKTKHERSIYHQINREFKGEKTFYHVMDNNKGFQMMLKKGWDQEKGLGPSGSGQKFPVKTILKRDRYGLGIKANEKPRITHFDPFDSSAVANKRPLSVKRTRKEEKLQNKKREQRERLIEINFRKQFH